MGRIIVVNLSMLDVIAEPGEPDWSAPDSWEDVRAMLGIPGLTPELFAHKYPHMAVMVVD